MTEPERDLYALLGVGRAADAAELARAYRRRLREVHPDTRDRPSVPDGSSADLRALQEAYAVLRDPLLRARYEARRRGTSARTTRVDVPVRVRGPRPADGWLLRAGPVRWEPSRDR